jgi:biotin carboxyl carrier protein
MAGIDTEVVRHALQIARDRGFAEVEIGVGEDFFRAALEPNGKKAPPKALEALGALDSNGHAEPELLKLKASQVGYYQPASHPLEVGQRVEKGSPIAAISALGLLNDIEATVSGEVVEVLVSEGDPVQYGQVIATVRP